MKCDICGKKIETTFLNKEVGIVFYDLKRKKRFACPGCQRRFPKKEDLLKGMK